MTTDHREISVAEFFEKNRHLLGFSNPQKAIVTCIKEAVDNSLDAAEEHRLLPELRIFIEPAGDNRLRFSVTDNAGGIPKEHIPKVFGKLLYGSKFHRMAQTRGQQGVGISAAGLYAQLTTGNPVLVISKLKGKKAHQFKVRIDTQKNEPVVEVGEFFQDFPFEQGTSIEMVIEGSYLRGLHSVATYMKQTAIMNPYGTFVLKEPDGTVMEFPRSVNILPPLAKEIKPHPHGVELGVLMRMVKGSTSRTVKSFLMNEFSRVGGTSANEIIKKAGLTGNERPNSLEKDHMDLLLRAMQNTKIQAPPTDCLSPLGEELMLSGLQKELHPEFTTAVTRSPQVYRGMPFQIEISVGYGGDVPDDPRWKVMRFANKVPLIYKKSACAITRAIKETDWGRYGLKQSGGIPMGPVSIAVHMCSVWVPFTSEGKEAVADYPEIVKEIKLALQEVGRRLKLYIGKRMRSDLAQKKVKRLTAYSKEMIPALVELAEDVDSKTLEEELHDLLHNKFLTGMLEGSAESGGIEDDLEAEDEEGEEEVEDNAQT